MHICDDLKFTMCSARASDEQQVECARVHRVQTDAPVCSLKEILMEKKKTFREKFDVNHGVTTKKLHAVYHLCHANMDFWLSLLSYSSSVCAAHAGSESHSVHYHILIMFYYFIIRFLSCYS